MEYNYKPASWDLSEILPQNPEDKFRELEDLINGFEKTRSSLNCSMGNEDFMHVLGLFANIREELWKFDAGLYMKYAEDISNSDSARMYSKMGRFRANVMNRMLFFDQWLKKELDDENFERLVAGKGDNEYYLRKERKFRRFALSEDVEQIINLKNSTGSKLLSELYAKLVSGFRYPIDVKGVKKTLNESQMSGYFFNSDPAKRAEAYNLILSEYSSFAPVLGELYIGIARDWHNENIQTRGYDTPISVTNYRNDVPDEAISSLLDVCRKNRGVFQRYFSIKEKICNIEGKISRTDVYAPIADTSGRKFSFGEAANLVMQTFDSFSPEIAKLAANIFEHKHIHSGYDSNKSCGAFCYGMPTGINPYVLVTFNGRGRDVATLAHELGHAVHGQLSNAEHGILTFKSSIPLAETASVFSETLVADKLITDAGDDKILKKEMLVSLLDNAYVALMRPAYFVMFENEAHAAINSGDGATVSQLSDIYYGLLQEQFGDSMSLPDYFKDEWVSIPHIFNTPFYCYSYPFGQLLSLSLYQRYKEEGSSFVPQYQKILAAGGSASPESILGRVGIDIKSADFWQSGFDALTEKVDELEKLV